MSAVQPKMQETAPARNEFGTFGGVFTPCILTILGVIMFMRLGFVVGQAGIFGAAAILLISKSITLMTALSTAAVGTNMQVRGGGAYYLISRVLGPEFGGAIGLALFLAQGISVPFYILGFTEALTQSFSVLEPYFHAVTLAAAAVLFLVAYLGAGWAIRVQYAVMAILALAIVSFLGGALALFSPAVFAENWASHFGPIEAADPETGRYTFWILFAIYFPAATGIMAGINMSGDLKDPARSIPRGTLAAIAVGFAVYLAQILICGGAFSRETLIARPFLVLKDHALGGGLVVVFGVFAATISSALGSFIAAPRVLQAVARDGIIAPLRPFAKGTARGDEPRRAILLTGLLTLGVLIWAAFNPAGNALNVVAGVITMFFLCTYGMLNVAAFIETVSGNPSFRPRFRYYHWGTALAGAAGCIAVALIISPVLAAAAIAVLAATVWYITRRKLRAHFGDARRGLVYKTVRNGLLRLGRMEEDSKNWRPTSLVFSGNPESREVLVTYAVWLEGGQGIVLLANVLAGSYEEYGPRRETAQRQLAEFCRDQRIPAFPVVLISEDLEQGISSVLQATGVGPLRPNLALFGWSEAPERLATTAAHFRMARALGMSVVVLRKSTRPVYPGPKHVDIWWRGMKNGGLMVLLAYLLTQNWEWAQTRLRLLRVIENEAGRESTRQALRELIDRARIEADAEILVDRRPFAEILQEHSGGADCVFMGFEIPKAGEEVAWYKRYEAMLPEERTVILVSSAGEEDILA